MLNITPDILRKQRELAHEDYIRSRVKEVGEAIKATNANGGTSFTAYLDKDVALVVRNELLKAKFETVLTTSDIGLYTLDIKW